MANLTERENDSRRPARTQHLAAAEALSRLPGPGGARSASLFEHGSLEVKIYAPRGVDPQQPHTRDEAYVVVQGSGEFVSPVGRRRFGPGDFLFAAAGVEHRFEEFSDDFTVWVFFYGPEGGEDPSEREKA